jgi:hypothetical protein
VRVEREVGQPWNRRLDDVRDREHGRALLLRLAHRLHRVERLAGLRHRDHQVALADDRIAIAKLAREIDLDGQARERLDQELADDRRVIRRATRDEHHALDVRHIELDAIEADVVAFEIDAADERIGDRARLLVDLLEHEVLEAALLGLDRRPRDDLRLADARLAFEVGDHHSVTSHRDELALLDEDHLAGLGQDRGDIAGDEVLAFAEADDQRRRVLRCDERPGLEIAHHDERVAAAHLRQRTPHRDRQVLGTGLQRALDEVGEDLGIGLRGELRATGCELGAQREVVLDDAVVDHRDRADLVRMAVLVGGSAMRGPPGVADADRAHRGLALELFL